MKRLSVFGLVIVLLLVSSVAVSAGATWDSFGGPTWTGSGNRWTVYILELSNPGKEFCPNSSTTGGRGGKSSCMAPAGGGTGVWTCNLTSQPNTTVTWDVGAWSDAAWQPVPAQRAPVAWPRSGQAANPPIVWAVTRAAAPRRKFPARMPAHHPIVVISGAGRSRKRPPAIALPDRAAGPKRDPLAPNSASHAMLGECPAPALDCPP